MMPDKNNITEEELDDETCRLLMKERADLAGITSAYFEHSSIHGLRYLSLIIFNMIQYLTYRHDPLPISIPYSKI